MNILIQNAVLLNNEIKGSVLKKYSIAIAEGKIVFIGEDNLAKEYLEKKSFRIIDADSKLVMPGMTNSHTHVAMTLLRGYYDDMPLQKWLFDYIFPAEDKMTAEIAYWSSMLGIAEMIKGGVTAFADMYFFMDQVADAVTKTGIKANLSRGLQCFDEDFNVKNDIRLQEASELYEKYNDSADGRIKVFFGPHSVYTCVPEYLRAAGELAEKYNTGIHIHLSENAAEVNECKAKYGVSPILHAYKAGLFNLPVLAAHCVVTDDEDMQCLNDNKVCVVHNPGSNLKLGSGIAPISKYIEKGINVVIGTDSASSNNNLDMFEELRMASLLQKGILQDSTVIDAAKAVYMATDAGSCAIGFNNSGKIKEGYAADLIIVDFDKLHLTPVTDFASHIAYSASSSDVDTVIVNGKILMEKRVLTTIDENEVKIKVREYAKKVFI